MVENNLLGVFQAVIEQYESGKRIPKIETLRKISEALGGSVFYDNESRKHHIIIPGEGNLAKIYPDPLPPKGRQEIIRKRKNSAITSIV